MNRVMGGHHSQPQSQGDAAANMDACNPLDIAWLFHFD